MQLDVGRVLYVQVKLSTSNFPASIYLSWLQGGPLLVINGVIAPINGLIIG